MTAPLATKPRALLTSHQRNVLEIVCAGNKSDDPTLALIDLDELLAVCAHRTTKNAMQFTIRALVHNGMMQKMERVARRGRMRAVYQATEVGKDLVKERNAVTVPTFVETAEETELEALLGGM